MTDEQSPGLVAVGPIFSRGPISPLSRSIPLPTGSLHMRQRAKLVTRMPLTLAERSAEGRSMRSRVPRSSHAAWHAPANRPDVVDFVREADRHRDAELLPIRYTRMSASAFGFLRGSAGLMAHDLTATPTTGWHVQLGGDAHLANFGAFATPERRLVFDLDDFDETLAGPWEWDLKRLVTSIMIVGREHRLPAAACSSAVLATARSYRLAMQGYAGSSYLALHYAELDAERVMETLSRPQRQMTELEVQRARSHDQLGALAKLTTVVDGRPRIVDRPPLLEHVPTSDPIADFQRLRDSYKQTVSPSVRELLEQYTLVDMARKVVGVGSVGTRCFIVLLLGRDDGDPLFLQIKEARSSVLEPYVGAAAFPNHAERVVAGQRRIQAASDIFLGWGTQDGTDYYVRQLQDMKGSPDVTKLRTRPLAAYGALCGWALARAHARSGDPIRLSAYLGRGDKLDRALAGFAEAYADQTERDYIQFTEAIRENRFG